MTCPDRAKEAPLALKALYDADLVDEEVGQGWRSWKWVIVFTMKNGVTEQKWLIKRDVRGLVMSANSSSTHRGYSLIWA